MDSCCVTTRELSEAGQNYDNCQSDYPLLGSTDLMPLAVAGSPCEGNLPAILILNTWTLNELS